MLSIISTNPAKDATNVSPNTVIELIFSEPIDTSTFSNGMVYIKSKDGDEIAFTSDFSTDALRLSITPTAPLDAGTAYTVYVSPTDLIAGKTLTATNGDTLSDSYYFDFYTMSAYADTSSDIQNVYTDPLYNQEFSISTNIEYTGMSVDTGGVVNDSGILVLNFSQDIDAASPQPLVMVEGETYLGEMYDPMANPTITGSHLYVSFGNIQPNSRLYITVPGTLKGIDGSVLSKDINTFVYTYLSPKPFSASRILARLGYKSAYFSEPEIYEAAMEAMMTASSWAETDLFSYTEDQITPQLSLSLVYLTMGILITKKYLNSAINQNTQLTVDVTTYKYSGMPSDLGAKYTQEGINLLRGIFPVAPSITKHGIRIFRPRWSNKVVFDKPGVNRHDNPPVNRGTGL
jgi:hypothetical protein